MDRNELGPLISIIVPVYKAEKYLDKCLKSIQAQTVHNFEVIVIDDGSPDKSGKICDAYSASDSRFKTFHQANEGVGKTRLIGIERATGEYVVWVDADDWIAPLFLERVLKSMKCKGSDIIVYGTAHVYEDNDIKRKIIPNGSSIDYWQRKTITSEQSVLWNFVSKRSLWKNIAMPEAVRYSGEDGYLAIELFFRAKSVSCINEVLYFHLLDNSASVSHTMNARKYYAHCFLWGFRKEKALIYCKEKVNYCEARVLSNGVKAFCISLVNKELEENELEWISRKLDKGSSFFIYGRYRDQFLAWCILNRWWEICRLYGKQKCKKLHSN